MSIEELKKKIKSKFRTVSRFCKIADLDRKEMQDFFQSCRNKMTKDKQVRLDKYYSIVVNTSNGDSEKDLTVSLRKQIKVKIRNMGGVQAFVDANPEFNLNSIYQIINGNRKTINQTVKDLMTKLYLK